MSLFGRCSVCRGVSLSGNRTRITTSIRGRGCLAIGTAARHGEGDVKCRRGRNTFRASRRPHYITAESRVQGRIDLRGPLTYGLPAS
jgi:hypothetical protein